MLIETYRLNVKFDILVEKKKKKSSTSEIMS